MRLLQHYAEDTRSNSRILITVFSPPLTAGQFFNAIADRHSQERT